MKQLVERGRVEAEQRGHFVDQALFDHVDGNLERGLGGALARTGLKEVEPAAFDCEFDVLHVAIVALQQFEHLSKLGIGLRHRFLH